MRNILLVASVVVAFCVFVVVADDDPFDAAPAPEPGSFDAVQVVDPSGPVADVFNPMPAPNANGLGGALPGDFGPMMGEVSETEQLQRQLFEAVRMRSMGMSPEELRRLIAFVETEEFELPAAAREILDSYHSQTNAARAEADQKIARYRLSAVVDLQELLARYIDTKQFEEAVAVRYAIRAMTISAVKVQDDPGTLSGLHNNKQRVLHFRVKGDTGGSVWGSGVYTSDSDLSTAAVHAGILKSGQSGVVRVTLLPGMNQYVASTRNGVTTSTWGNYSSSYRVTRLVTSVPDLSGETEDGSAIDREQDSPEDSGDSPGNSPSEAPLE